MSFEGIHARQKLGGATEIVVLTLVLSVGAVGSEFLLHAASGPETDGLRRSIVQPLSHWSSVLR